MDKKGLYLTQHQSLTITYKNSTRIFSRGHYKIQNDIRPLKRSSLASFTACQSPHIGFPSGSLASSGEHDHCPSQLRQQQTLRTRDTLHPFRRLRTLTKIRESVKTNNNNNTYLVASIKISRVSQISKRIIPNIGIRVQITAS